MRVCFHALILAVWASFPVAIVAQSTTTEVRLVLSAESARAGDTVEAAVHLHLAPGWHTYWRNPGEYAMPIKVEWVLPPDVSVGPVAWATPKKGLFFGETNNYYEKDAVVLAPLVISPTLKPGPLKIRAKVTWQECKETCIPGKAEAEADLVVGTEVKPSAGAAFIAEWQAKVPRPDPGISARGWWGKTITNDVREIVLQWAVTQAYAHADFLAFENEKLEFSPSFPADPQETGKMSVRLTVKKSSGEWPTTIPGVLLLAADGKSPPEALEVTFGIADSTEPKSTTAPAGQGGSVIEPPREPLWKMLFYAFVGGIILNVMPCVLPVISLKILGFVQQSKEAPGRVARMGFLYGLGVLVSFLVLAGLVIGLQKAGKAAGWGVQFQNPQFVVVMTTMVTLVSLNLFGLFEVNLGGGTLNTAGELASKEGAAGAFFNGMLATLLATPCTAPFMAAAVGFAFTAQSSGVIISIFVAMAIGLASPYVVLSCMPQWMKFLPRPGAWMEKFKIAMGFPMLATAIWLLTLTTPHFGSRGPLWVGLFLVVLALAAWIWGEFVQRGRTRRGLAIAVCLLLLGGGYGYALERELQWRSPPVIAAGPAGASLRESADGIDWMAWNPAEVEKARKAGLPILVDFTADWCVSCQANKKTSIEIDSVRKKLREMRAVSLLGDYTRENSLITAELKKFQRAGVPLVLVYPKNGGEPLVLPAILTPGIVLDALDQAAR